MFVGIAVAVTPRYVKVPSLVYQASVEPVPDSVRYVGLELIEQYPEGVGVGIAAEHSPL
jgi:hypothetical protein